MWGEKSAQIKSLKESLKSYEGYHDEVKKERNTAYDSIYVFLTLIGKQNVGYGFRSVESLNEHIQEIKDKREQEARLAEVENIVLNLLKREKLIKVK